MVAVVPTGVEEEVQPHSATGVPTAKMRRSHSSRAQMQQGAAGEGEGEGEGDGEVGAAASSPEGEGGFEVGGGVDGEAVGQRRQRRRRRRTRRKNLDVVLDNRTRIKRRVKYLLMKMRVDQNLLDAYSGEGWKGQSREKIRPEQELQRAEAQILHSKLAIREAIHELDDLGLEGSLDENAFDAEGRVYHEEIFCAKCKSQDALPDNDIILCDGACNRGFHQYCLDPPLATINIPPGDEGWLCPVCDCKMECIEVINAYLGTNFEVENSWEMLFATEALIAAGGGTQDGADGDFPSSDSQDDDYDPEGGEKWANSGSEGENDGDGEDRDDSDSGNGFRENGASLNDNDEQDLSDATNLKRLGREVTGVFSDSDDSEVSLVDEFKDGDATLGLELRDSQAEESASDEEAMVIGGKRNRKAVDYKRLYDEMFGNTEIDDDNVASDDEDWGPERRRRRTIPDDPSRPRPPQVRRRRARSDLPSASQGDGATDTPGERDKRMWRRLPDSAVEALRRVVVVNTLPSKSHKEELATQLGLSFSQVHGWFKNQRHQALRKGLVSSKRPHLVASSSKGVNSVNGVKTLASEQAAVTESTLFENEDNSNAYLTEKLDEVQLRLLELKQTLEDFARTTRVVDDEDRSCEADNNFVNGGIGLPANGRRIVYVPVAEVRERPPVSTHTSAC